MCRDCRPEYLESCYLCGHRFRVFESFYIVKRLMDRGGIENQWYGIRYARCRNCPVPQDKQTYSTDWNARMGEGKRRGS